LKEDKIKISSNRSFGIVFFILFFIIAIFPLLSDGNIRVWSAALSIIFLILGLMNSSILYPLNKIWFKFGILLGKIVSPIVLGVIFFFVVTPIGILMKILGKDLLNLKNNNEKSYWIKRSEIKSKMKDQF
jgi:hypothetical protein|tara:strand:+ start:49 stop:438 length:390 start_codon:yes stop_codon:yes gene_type:complete